MRKNIVDYVERWPKNPERYISRVCRTFGYKQPISFAPGKIEGRDNLVLDATLADGQIYRLAHSPIQEQRGAIINRRRTTAENAYISRVRSAAGKRGGVARWANVKREPTVQVRAYKADAEWLRRRAKTIPAAIRELIEEAK